MRNAFDATYKRKYGQLPPLNPICEHNTYSLLTLSYTREYINTAGWLPRWEHTLGDRNNRPLQSVKTAETQWHHTKHRDASLSPSLIHGRGSNGGPLACRDKVKSGTRPQQSWPFGNGEGADATGTNWGWSSELELLMRLEMPRHAGNAD